jgi:hypothetical protein
MSLRNEIDLEIGKHLQKWKDSITIDEVRDISIKIFEKRIDSISIPDMVNGIYNKPSMESMAKYMIQQFKELLK